MKVCKLAFTLICIYFLVGCQGLLEEKVFSQLSTDNFLSTEEGLETVLYQGYNIMQRNGNDLTVLIHSDAFMTGRGNGVLGAWEGSTATPYRTWNWLPTQWDLVTHWNFNYDLIYNCNTILDNLETYDFSEEFTRRLKGEALALRGYAYYVLFDYFGEFVIHTTTRINDLNQPRASIDDCMKQIENDLLDASEFLPVTQSQYGRITKGGALGMLCKFYLNTKQWEKCNNIAKEIMDLNIYSLFSDFTTLFHIENAGNSEVLWVQPAANLPNQRNTIAGLTYPANWRFAGSQTAFPAVVYVPDWFVDSYMENDVRAEVIVKQYISKAGVTVTGYGKNQSIPFKYGLDSNADGGNAANDYIELRYADIILSRAEALNEIQGPNIESINLINMVRDRANISLLKLENIRDKEDLRDSLLQEREWEFHFEGKTRQDLIRHGKLISDAQHRGISKATEIHNRYPIPQSEMDANPNMIQNTGY
jgi:hypothetical protein